MTTTIPRPEARRSTGDPTRGYARAGGIPYLLTFAASIPAVFLLDPVLHDPTQDSGWTIRATLPIATWELAVGCYLTVKGFRPEAIEAWAARS